MLDHLQSLFEAGGNEVATAAGGARKYRKPLKCFRWRDIKAILSASIGEWTRHKAPRLGASLAFYTLLSLTPLLLVVLSIVGLAFGPKAAQTDIIEQVQSLVGAQGAKAVSVLLEGSRNTTHGLITTLVGLVT